jgi:inosine-uridine nucleoside N-ribohydrolase
MNNLFEPLKDKKRIVILDTDIGPDCDDAGAIAILFNLQKRYGFTVKGMVNCSSNAYGTKALQALCKYYGYNEILIGENENFDGLGNQNKYNKYLAMSILPSIQGEDNIVMSSTELYKSILKEAEDDDVIVITIGSFLTVSEALRTHPELWNTKVHAVISMAGCFNKRKREFNAVWNVASTQYFFNSFKNPIICTGVEVGADIITGFPEMAMPDMYNPVKMAYYLFTEGENTRPSWDLTAVIFAVEGVTEYFRLSPRGNITFTDEGITEFEPSKTGKHMFMVKDTDNDTISSYINGLLEKSAVAG